MTLPINPCPFCGEERVKDAGNLHQMIFCEHCGNRAADRETWNEHRTGGERLIRDRAMQGKWAVLRYRWTEWRAPDLG